ncbi:hypothetical protein ACNKHR_17695 [Shigella flexneri]
MSKAALWKSVLLIATHGKERFQGNFYVSGAEYAAGCDLRFIRRSLQAGGNSALPGILLFAITAAGTARRVDLNTIET